MLSIRNDDLPRLNAKEQKRMFKMTGYDNLHTLERDARLVLNSIIEGASKGKIVLFFDPEKNTVQYLQVTRILNYKEDLIHRGVVTRPNLRRTPLPFKETRFAPKDQITISDGSLCFTEGYRELMLVKKSEREQAQV